MRTTRLLATRLSLPLVVVGMLACGDDGGSAGLPVTGGGAAGAAGAANGGSAGKAGGAGASTAGSAGKGGSSAGAAGKGGSAGQPAAGAAGQPAAGAAGQPAAGAAGQPAAGAAGQPAAGAAGQPSAGAAGQPTGGAAGQTTGGSAGQAGTAGTGGAAGTSAGGAAGASAGGAAGASAGGAAGTSAGGAAGTDAGGSAGAGGGADPGVKAACTALATAQCDKRKDCLNDQPARIWGPGGVQDCIDGLTAQCIDVTKDPSTKVKAADRLVCAKATKDATCTEWRATGPLPGCEPVAGADDNGATCTFDTECKSTYCQRERDASCGKCAPLPTEGADCTVYDCGPQALGCQASAAPSGAAKTCQKRGAVGDVCTKDSACDDGLRCATGAIGLKKTCLPAGQTGDLCDADADCDQGLGFVCKPGSGPLAKGSCVASAFAAPGDACGAKAKGALCSKGSSCVEGICVKYAAEGESCSLTAGPDCLPFASCIQSLASNKHACVLLSEAICK